MGIGDKRIASILLAFCRTHTLSAGELAERLEVSERTVRNDIKHAPSMMFLASHSKYR